MSPRCRVDPEGRCACVCVFGTHMLILPFMKRGAEKKDRVPKADWFEVSPDCLSLFSASPYFAPLSSLDLHENTVLDFCFLHNASVPTVLVAASTPVKSWSARMAQSKLSAVAVAAHIILPFAHERVEKVASHRLRTIWSRGKLPHDTLRVIPIPSSPTHTAGGSALVVSVNGLQHVGASYAETGVLLANAYAPTTLQLSADEVKRATKIEAKNGACAFTLDASTNAWLDSSHALFSLRGRDDARFSSR